MAIACPFVMKVSAKNILTDAIAFFYPPRSHIYCKATSLKSTLHYLVLMVVLTQHFLWSRKKWHSSSGNAVQHMKLWERSVMRCRSRKGNLLFFAAAFMLCRI